MTVIAWELFNLLIRLYAGAIVRLRTHNQRRQCEFEAWLVSRGKAHNNINLYSALIVFTELHRVLVEGKEPRYDFGPSPVWKAPWQPKARAILAWWVRAGAEKYLAAMAGEQMNGR